MQKKGNQANSASTAPAGKGKPYSGWTVAIAGAIAVLAADNFHYTFGVFVQPIVDKFGWSRAAVSGCVSARSVISGIASPVFGFLSDRYNPRKLILMGIFIVGAGYLLASLLTSIWQLYLFLSFFLGLGMVALFIPIISIVTKWFGGRAALANGIVMSGFGLAQIILPPLVTFLILRFGLAICFIVLGITALVAGSLAWKFIRMPPTADEEKPMPVSGATFESISTLPGAGIQYKLSDVLRTRTLWILFLVFMVVANSYQMIMIHIVPAAIDAGVNAEAAAIILTLSGASCTLGRLGIGFVSAKIGSKTTLSLCLALQALLLFPLAGARDLTAFYAITTIYGLAYGGVTPLIPVLVGEIFGTRLVGSTFGVLNAAYTAGAAIGPLLAGYVFDVTGSYYIAFLYAGVVMAVAFVSSVMLPGQGGERGRYLIMGVKNRKVMLTEKQVVTCFLESEGGILILRRSEKVGSYQGRWAGVSGYVETAPDEQALTEMMEEVGLLKEDVKLLKKGEPLPVEDEQLGVRWIVNPYLFHLKDRGKIRIDWEHKELKWIKPEAIGDFKTVPRLKEALARVYDF